MDLKIMSRLASTIAIQLSISLFIKISTLDVVESTMSPKKFKQMTRGMNLKTMEPGTGYPVKPPPDFCLTLGDVMNVKHKFGRGRSCFKCCL